MKIDLVKRHIPFSGWRIRIDEKEIPVRWESWYVETFQWFNGDVYCIDFKSDIAITRNGRGVCHRSARMFGHQWEGDIPLKTSGRCLAVKYRTPAGRLVMQTRARILPGVSPLVISNAVPEEKIPALCAIAMATLYNFDG